MNIKKKSNINNKQMGIKHFWRFFKNRFSEDIQKMRRGDTFADEHIQIEVDNFMIDMNGLYHGSAQKVYQYGEYALPKRLLGRRGNKRNGLQTQIACFKDICDTIELLVSIVKPKKRLILCVDGPAPISKQSQQRGRRFRSAQDRDEKSQSFDSNAITPGTKWMDYLSKYIDWYIRKRMSEDEKWQKIDVVFSSEKAAGEGEHKCFLAGTLIILYNGETKKVEDIKVGNQVIGDDGTPRTVTSLVSGDDEMYEVVQNNAENYTVNKGHILSLQIADHKRIYWDEKDGNWVVGFYNRKTDRYQRKHFTGLREGETVFAKMDESDRTCIECEVEYTRRECYAQHMKRVHNISVPKLKTMGRTTTKSKEEARNEALKFMETISDDNVLDISVVGYLTLPKNTQRKLYGFRCPGVKWDKKDVDIDPYLLGLWLGDGDYRNPTICTVDNEIIQYLEEYCVNNDFRLSHNDKYIKYRICDPDLSRRPSRIMSWIKKYNLLQNKHIPNVYKVNDEETRLKILAGIIDSDGNVTKNGRLVRISQCLQHENLVNDIVYLAQSLGFCVNVRKEKCSHKYNGEKKIGEAYQITLSGDLHKIPTLIKRKKCSPPPIPGENGRSIVVDKLRTSIKVVPIGRDKYYGFNTDGNHRFLLGDFTVTHNCLNYIRLHGIPEETFCIHGADADLIMLSLGTHYPNFYILRDDMYNKGQYFAIDIGGVREELVEILIWGGDNFVGRTSVDDFILMCFMVGNDFLPHIPAIEIIEGGIDTMIDVYKQVCEEYGHLTECKNGKIRFVKKPLEIFLGTLAQYEQGILQDKMVKKESFFPDPVLEVCSKQKDDGTYEVDIVKYRKDYYNENLPEANQDMKKFCHDYLEGVQWVLSYYTSGVPNWKWRFRHHYSPFAHTLAKYTSTFRFPRYGYTKPTTPFIQLLSVLPPKSSALIPPPLNSLLTSETSPLKEFCPTEFHVDLCGKRQEWEGTVILPMIDYSTVEKLYLKMRKEIDSHENKRNVLGKSFLYTFSPTSSFHFRSYYGDIDCKVQCQPIEI